MVGAPRVVGSGGGDRLSSEVFLHPTLTPLDPQWEKRVRDGHSSPPTLTPQRRRFRRLTTPEPTPHPVSMSRNLHRDATIPLHRGQN